MVEMMMVVLKKEQEEMAESEKEQGAEKVGRHERAVRARKAKKKKKKKKEKNKEKEKERVVHEPQRKHACVDCTSRCARVHGRASPSESKKSRPVATTLPSFFKVMMGCFSEIMDIPPPFAKTISDLTGSNIYLEDAFGLRWRVYLGMHGDFLSFGHGWKNFVLDHAISVGEFLVFRQISRSVFTVQIFATSACERLHLCESNQRQCRKKRPREKTSSPCNQTLKIIKTNPDKRIKKKRRTCSLQNDLSMRNRSVSVGICVDSETPRVASELKCCETSEEIQGIGAAGSDEVDEVLARDQDKAQYLLDGETKTADECTIRKQKEAECNADAGELHTEAKTLESIVVIDASSNKKYMTVDADIETENCRGSGVPTNSELGTYLAMMDLNRDISDDIFLSADAYEFESIFYNPEAFSAELGIPSTHGQTSGFRCVKDEDNIFLPPDGNTVEPKEGFVPKDSSAKQDHLQDDSDTVHIAAETMPGSPKPGEIPEPKQNPTEPGNNSESLRSGTRKKANNRKFCVAVPPPDQTWLELPCRLPVLPRRKKQGRKIMVLKDPCGRRWPVLYQCTPGFNGFIAGWVEIRAENSLREGDAYEFQLSAGNSELSFQVRAPVVPSARAQLSVATHSCLALAATCPDL